MEQTGQSDLFDIKLTASGKLYIRKFAVLTRIIILIGLVISGIHIATTVISYVKFDPKAYAEYKLLVLENKILPYYTLVYCILFYPQMYFYWQVTGYLKKGLNYSNEAAFNKAFQSLYRYSLFGLASIALSSLFYGFELYYSIKGN